MKKLIYFAAIAVTLISCKKDDPKAYSSIDQISISTGEGYQKDIYYSLQNGIVKESNRTDWDIAFTTDPMTSSIYINDGNGVMLYLWGDLDAYETVDTVGILTKEPMYNDYSAENWQSGAFDQNASGHPDYGWGTYDMASHDLTGHSTFVVVFADGSAKKMIVEKREASSNTFYLKYANLDGSDEQTPSIVCADYVDKNMIHFSMSSNAVIDHEPASDSWDLLFTKYITMIDMGVMVPYPVTGILSNNGIEISKNAESDTASHEYLSAT